MPNRVNYNKLLNRLLQTWILCYGAITLLAVAGYFVPHKLLPLIAFLLLLGVSGFRKFGDYMGTANCTISLRYTIYAIFASGLIMLIINMSYKAWLGHLITNTITPQFPYITTTIVYPLATIAYAIAWYRRGHSWYCTTCRQRAGYSVKDTQERNLFHIESQEQLKLGFGLSLAISVITAAYYYFFYINININSPDTFFFFITPVVFYLLSIAFFVAKYGSIKFRISMGTLDQRQKQETGLRFMVIRNDKILLEEINDEINDIYGVWDTPAVINLPHTEEMTDEEAHDIFKTISGCDNFEVKHLYNSDNDNSNVVRFAIILTQPDEETPGLEGTWFNIYEIDTMLKNRQIAKPFAEEINRVYVMTMAWKTYDKNGKRIYPIKNYRPTFRLADFHNWDIDYSDLRWLRIAENNEDKPFFNLRRWYSNLVSGNESRWRRSQS